ncbi:hypothetical protein GIB67_031818 [Kingdonia uniflora]|uniref:Uncharacterized protein n=1 Tax=Kingdonia uniflora TaxID=39325 RepID=A0A7J7L4N4_9MAGN|nr:hypothetical protein GIB67_031818 [Kingdonia uniflora]
MKAVRGLLPLVAVRTFSNSSRIAAPTPAPSDFKDLLVLIKTVLGAGGEKHDRKHKKRDQHPMTVKEGTVKIFHKEPRTIKAGNNTIIRDNIPNKSVGGMLRVRAPFADVIVPTDRKSSQMYKCTGDDPGVIAKELLTNSCDNDFQELSTDDYFSKNNEFATWLKEKKGLFFSDLSSDVAREKFLGFIKDWNNHKLESRYYVGITSGPRTAHNWKVT